ncbi:hypothetical protein ACFL6C_13705 [Myxococcota bacterium]
MAVGNKGRRKKRNKGQKLANKRNAVPPLDGSSKGAKTDTTADVHGSPKAEQEVSGRGLLTGIRRTIATGHVREEGVGFFSKRRTLSEWALWAAGAVVIYLLWSHFST